MTYTEHDVDSGHVSTFEDDTKVQNGAETLREIISRNRDTGTILRDGIKATIALEQAHRKAETEQPHWMVEMYCAAVWCVRFAPDEFDNVCNIELRKGTGNHEFLRVVKHLYRGAAYDIDDEIDRDALSHRQRYIAYGFLYCSDRDLAPEQFEAVLLEDRKFTQFSKLQQEMCAEAKPKKSAPITDDTLDDIGGGAGSDGDGEEDDEGEEDSDEDGDSADETGAALPSGFVYGVIFGDHLKLTILRDLLGAALSDLDGVKDRRGLDETDIPKRDAIQAMHDEICAYMAHNFPPDDGSGKPVSNFVESVIDSPQLEPNMGAAGPDAPTDGPSPAGADDAGAADDPPPSGGEAVPDDAPTDAAYQSGDHMGAGDDAPAEQPTKSYADHIEPQHGFRPKFIVHVEQNPDGQLQQYAWFDNFEDATSFVADKPTAYIGQLRDKDHYSPDGAIHPFQYALPTINADGLYQFADETISSNLDRKFYIWIEYNYDIVVPQQMSWEDANALKLGLAIQEPDLSIAMLDVRGKRLRIPTTTITGYVDINPPEAPSADTVVPSGADLQTDAPAPEEAQQEGAGDDAPEDDPPSSGGQAVPDDEAAPTAHQEPDESAAGPDDLRTDSQGLFSSFPDKINLDFQINHEVSRLAAIWREKSPWATPATHEGIFLDWLDANLNAKAFDWIEEQASAYAPIEWEDVYNHISGLLSDFLNENPPSDDDTDATENDAPTEAPTPASADEMGAGDDASDEPEPRAKTITQSAVNGLHRGMKTKSFRTNLAWFIDTDLNGEDTVFPFSKMFTSEDDVYKFFHAIIDTGAVCQATIYHLKQDGPNSSYSSYKDITVEHDNIIQAYTQWLDENYEQVDTWVAKG